MRGGQALGENNVAQQAMVEGYLQMEWPIICLIDMLCVLQEKSNI